MADAAGWTAGGEEGVRQPGEQRGVGVAGECRGGEGELGRFEGCGVCGAVAGAGAAYGTGEESVYGGLAAVAGRGNWGWGGGGGRGGEGCCDSGVKGTGRGWCT